MREIVVIAHNLRSSHNVGSLLRTADGLGINKVYLTGYTPYPKQAHDDRLPHIITKIHKQIYKTALGAESSVNHEHVPDIAVVLSKLADIGYTIVGLEQSPDSVTLAKFKPTKKVALILGREVEGIEPEVLKKCDINVEIPMHGAKESFNVAVAAAIAMYHIQHYPFK